MSPCSRIGDHGLEQLLDRYPDNDMAVKQPWEIFVEALREQLARHDVEIGSGRVLRKVPEIDVPRMSTAMANAVLDHLTSVEGLSQEEALEVTKLFFAELSRPSSESLGNRLRRVWEDWAET